MLRRKSESLFYLSFEKQENDAKRTISRGLERRMHKCCSGDCGASTRAPNLPALIRASSSTLTRRCM